MKNPLKEKVEVWLSEVLNQVSTYKPATIHIDELLQTYIDKKDYLNISIEIFLTLVENVEKHGAIFQPILGIPLVSTSKKLKLTVPDTIKKIEKDLIDTPPSIYLIDWEAKKHLNILEGYICPLPSSLFMITKEGIFVKYSELRSEISIERNFEYVRSITLEYFPERFRKK